MLLSGVLPRAPVPNAAHNIRPQCILCSLGLRELFQALRDVWPWALTIHCSNELPERALHEELNVFKLFCCVRLREVVWVILRAGMASLAGQVGNPLRRPHCHEVLGILRGQEPLMILRSVFDLLGLGGHLVDSSLVCEQFVVVR